MNFAVESAAMKAAEEGERSAALAAATSPTSTSAQQRPQTAPNLFTRLKPSTFDPKNLMTPEQDRQVWSMMQQRLSSQSQVTNPYLTAYSQSSNPFLLDTSTIPKKFIPILLWRW